MVKLFSTEFLIRFTRRHAMHTVGLSEGQIFRVLICLTHLLDRYSKGSFINHVDLILHFFDHQHRYAKTLLSYVPTYMYQIHEFNLRYVLRCGHSTTTKLQQKVEVWILLARIVVQYRFWFFGWVGSMCLFPAVVCLTGYRVRFPALSVTNCVKFFNSFDARQSKCINLQYTIILCQKCICSTTQKYTQWILLQRYLQCPAQKKMSKNLIESHL